MIKRTLFVIICIFLSTSIFAQKSVKIDLLKSTNKALLQEKVKITDKGIELTESLSSIKFIKEETKQGSFLNLSSENMSKSYDVGKPNLPVISKLIEIPNNSKAVVKILHFDEEFIQLNDYNLTEKIIPAQPSLSKSDDPKTRPFYKNKEVYQSNRFYKNDIVKIDDRGYLRDKHLGYVEISPFEYNPVTNTLKVLNNIEYEINFIPNTESPRIKTSYIESPYFNGIVNTVNKVASSKSLISGPVKYVIVSDRMFEETLQPFIEWKTMKGFNVIEAYTDESNVGNTTTSIKTYLKDLYENPTDGVSPTFVLFVGDVDQIPAFDTELSGDYHVTDLYYCEYTEDKLPEVFYGRFSATTVEQLQPQIDKTLEVEKYQMPDPSYLNNVVLVAGVDAGAAPTFGNGFVNYTNQYYTNAENGITSYYYLYEDESGVMSSSNSGASASIQSYISAGVSIANYTAHCGASGWSDPSFSNSDVANMTNEHMYPLMIGNCCQSVKFELTSFGEEVLRASGKGAVGYIGGSDFSYWDEDFHWGVGLSAISANPTYETSGLGSYDSFFHLKDEAKSDWYVTQGQMVFAGNLAVEASSSGRKDYYWEIYHLMGDPSLTPYVTVPEELTATYNSEVVIGTSSFTVNTEEDAYVAISFNGELLDAKLVDASGITELTYDELSNVGELDLVITKQNRQPKIDKINVIATTTPYVVLDQYTINDSGENNNGEADYNEAINLNVQLKNVADAFDALLVSATLSTTNTKAVISKAIQSYETVEMSTSKLINNAFSINFGNDFADQESVEFLLTVVGEDNLGADYIWNSRFSIKVNAPKLQINDFIIDDSNHNNDGILDAGETANIQLSVENKGHAAISGVTAKATLLGNGSEFLTLNTAELTNLTFNMEEVQVVNFNVTAGADVEKGTLVNILFDIIDVSDEKYTVSGEKELTIGKVEDILISQEGTVTTKIANFYDAGGKDNDYGSNENYVITFLPEAKGKAIEAEFLSFNVEVEASCDYDYLKIYDGSTTSGALIGKYCGTTSPGKVSATNTAGALTFEFISDSYDVESGWEAQIRNISVEFSGYDVTFSVTQENNQALENVTVNFNSETVLTNASGLAIFREVYSAVAINYTLSKEGFVDMSGTVDVENSDKTINLEMVMATGVDGFTKEDINVYPNPSLGIFNIDIPNVKEQNNYTIKIYDILGSVVYSKSLHGASTIHEKIDVSGKTKGIYFLTVEADYKSVVTQKIVIK
ncbi:MAG: T9SS type A sorting domain-containing protein [Bacteroidales bacterium]|nr:T9SS type A sorting domain-containing protein [Bacteroidales bacterium]